MNKNLTNLFLFTAGAIIGSAVTWVYAKEHYAQVADVEIESMRKWFEVKDAGSHLVTGFRDGLQADSNDARINGASDVILPISTEKPDLKTYAKMVEGLGYTDYANAQKSEKEPEEVEDVLAPHIIAPEEFGENGYREVSLTYYADGILVDEGDKPIKDVDGTVGADYASHFGEYEDDSVFIRNDAMQIDFEILRDLRNYSDIYQSKPYPAEDE